MTHPAFAAGNTAVITGAASGLGLAAAKRLAGMGLNVCLADRNAEALRQAAAEIGTNRVRTDVVDVAQPALDAAVKRCRDYAAKAVRKRRMSQAQADDVLANLHPTLDYDSIADVDWVLEAATEDIDLKRRIFARVEAIVRPDALITSNTSSLPAAQIFSALSVMGRATVTHFFAPAWRNPVVEVIRWPGIEPSLVDHLSWLFCMTGKVPLVTDDVPCFMLDRVFDNWCNEAALTNVRLVDVTARPAAPNCGR